MRNRLACHPVNNRQELHPAALLAGGADHHPAVHHLVVHHAVKAVHHREYRPAAVHHREYSPAWAGHHLRG